MPDPVQTYSELHPTPICSTISVLARRIHERFPGSGLSQVAAELVLVVLFLASLETRLKRRTALRMLHRLRSVAHIVDMHQLTKDPELALRRVQSTASSPSRTLSRTQLPRYLDYCSELLALASKLAALHAQHLSDAVVPGAVNDIEALTADLSRKIWQKISIRAMAAPQSSAVTASTLDRETAG